MGVMIKNISVVLWAACAVAAARPGDLDRGFDPELHAWVAPGQVTMAGDGRAWLGGGFDRGDEYSTGELVVLGANGGVYYDPAQGYLKKTSNAISIEGGSFPSTASAPFLLASGDFLLPGESGGWLRMNADGVATGKAFPDRQAHEEITPQFERNGVLWVIRKSASGQRLLEQRNSADGQPAGVFLKPLNVRAAIPGTGGSVWILAGEDVPWFQLWNHNLPEKQLVNVDAAGNVIGAAKIIRNSREMRLIAGNGGAFHIEFGPVPTWWMYWPSPSFNTYTLEWYSPEGVFERRKSFQVSLGTRFSWAESPDGALLATTGNGRLLFQNPGEITARVLPGFSGVRSIKSLPDGKWLIDGLHRLHADGSEDESWTPPELSTPAQVTALHPMTGGRMLAGGNFALADGIVSNRLAVFLKTGEIDPSFIPDDRIGEWRSVAATSEAIYVVTEEPVSYGDAIRSNLVKLGPDGALDEGYFPLVPLTSWTAGVTKQTVDHVNRVIAMTGGDILVETSSMGGDILIRNLVRLKSNGVPNPNFRPVGGGLGTTVLARANGGFAADGLVYQANGAIEADLSKPNIHLRPLCEHAGGVIFAEATDGGAHRLRLWTRRGWAAWFKTPALENAYSARASSGEFGMLYVSAALKGGSQSMLRLLPNGRLDRSFRSAGFVKRERQHAGGWWTAEESGKLAFDPAIHEFAMPPQTILWHPATRRLWCGGAFNIVDRMPRDGLARLSGGFSPWRWW